MSTFTPSVYQEAIFTWVEQSDGNAFVDAAAGAGKSTTLVHAAALLPRKSKALFCAFNKHIARELETRLKEVGSKMVSRTIHSVGRGALVVALKRGQYVQDLAEPPDARKYQRLADEYILTTAKKAYQQAREVWSEQQQEREKSAWNDPESQRLDAVYDEEEEEERFPEFEVSQLAGYLRKLVDFRRLTLTEPTEEALRELADYYDLGIEFETEQEEELFWPLLTQGVEVVIQAGASEYQRLGIIDYTDMVFLPIYLDLSPARYDFIFVDEAQDLNAAQLELVMRASKVGARWLFCGDAHQSMYAFTGADTRSTEHIIRRVDAQVLPLSICYRCPTSHIDLAQQVYSNIEASPTAGPGVVQVLSSNQVNDLARPRDYIICRTTAPLVTRCFALIRENKKAVVLGKDLGKNMIDLVKKLIRRKGYSWRDLIAVADEYQREQERILSEQEGNDLAIAQVRDKVSTLKALHTAYLSNLYELEAALNVVAVQHSRRASDRTEEQGSLVGFTAFIENFFKPEEDEDGKQIDYSAFITLSTIHKAKGLEADRVFIDRPDLLPHPAAKKDWQCEQEQNILYVALTRAKKELYFIDQAPRSIELPEEARGPLPIVVVHGAEGTSVFLDEEEGDGEPGEHSALPAVIPARVDGQALEPFHGETVIVEAEAVIDDSLAPLVEGRVARIAAIEVLCPVCSGLCVDPATGALTITPDLVGHTVVCSRCRKSCIVPLNAFSLQGNVIAREKPVQAVPNTQIEKKGRTKKERKSNAGAKTRGKEPRQPLQLSLDMRVIRAIKSMGINASALFEELLNQYEPFLEVYAMVNDEDSEEEEDEV